MRSCEPRAAVGVLMVGLMVGLVGLAALGAGCGHRVGDTCQTNVDCSALGDRFCDTSAPAGYCTVEGCDVRMNNNGDWVDSCPSEAVCVRFFSLEPSRPCDHPNAAPTSTMTALHCTADERCLCDSSNASSPNLCTGKGTSHCAPESTERRWCLLRCSSNSDCRGGFECRPAGTRGAELVPQERLVDPSNPTPSFCVQCTASGNVCRSPGT